MGVKVQLRNVRLGFHDLWKAKVLNGGKPKFSASLISSEDSEIRFENAKGEKKTYPLLGGPDSIINRIIMKVIKEKWPTISEKGLREMEIWCWNKADGSTTRNEQSNDDGEYYAGFGPETWYATAAKIESKAPGGVAVMTAKKVPITEASGKLFSGCYVNAILDIYANETETGKTISASLEGIQLKKRGEPLGFTAIDANDEFDEEESEDEDEDDDVIDDKDDLFAGTDNDEPF